MFPVTIISPSVFKTSPTVRNTLKNSFLDEFMASLETAAAVLAEACFVLTSCQWNVSCSSLLSSRALHPTIWIVFKKFVETWYTSKFNSASNGLSPLVVSAVKFKLGDERAFQTRTKRACLDWISYKIRDCYRWISRLKTLLLNVVGTLLRVESLMTQEEASQWHTGTMHFNFVSFLKDPK